MQIECPQCRSEVEVALQPHGAATGVVCSECKLFFEVRGGAEHVTIVKSGDAVPQDPAQRSYDDDDDDRTMLTLPGEGDEDPIVLASAELQALGSDDMGAVADVMPAIPEPPVPVAPVDIPLPPPPPEPVPPEPELSEAEQSFDEPFGGGSPLHAEEESSADDDIIRTQEHDVVPPVPVSALEAGLEPLPEEPMDVGMVSRDEEVLRTAPDLPGLGMAPEGADTLGPEPDVMDLAATQRDVDMPPPPPVPVPADAEEPDDPDDPEDTQDAEAVSEPLSIPELQIPVPAGADSGDDGLPIPVPVPPTPDAPGPDLGGGDAETEPELLVLSTVRGDPDGQLGMVQVVGQVKGTDPADVEAELDSLRLKLSGDAAALGASRVVGVATRLAVGADGVLLVLEGTAVR